MPFSFSGTDLKQKQPNWVILIVNVATLCECWPIILYEWNKVTTPIAAFWVMMKKHHILVILVKKIF